MTHGRDLRDLVARLAALRVEGPSFGGPHVGVSHNEVTRAILSEGKKMVPLLVDRLKTSGWDETVFIVFLLRELQAKEAKETLRHLEGSRRFENVGRDLTLAMELKFFMRDVDSWRR